MNFAGIHKLPVIYVVENNGYAISVPMSLQSAVEDIAVRGAGYGMPGVIVDGSDVLGCYRAGKAAIDRARGGEGPTLIEAKVSRLTAHSSDDQQTKYRTAEELESEQGKDPLPVFRDQLRAAGMIDEAGEAEILAESRKVVEDATEWAESQPDPDRPCPADVYANERRRGWAIRWDLRPIIGDGGSRVLGGDGYSGRGPRAPTDGSWVLVSVRDTLAKNAAREAIRGARRGAAEGRRLIATMH